MKNCIRCDEVRAFCNGKDHQVANVMVEVVYDNLIDKLIFKYTLGDIDKQYAGEGYVELVGTVQYGTWDKTKNGAYSIVFTNLGLTFYTYAP